MEFPISFKAQNIVKKIDFLYVGQHNNNSPFAQCHPRTANERSKCLSSFIQKKTNVTSVTYSHSALYQLVLGPSIITSLNRSLVDSLLCVVYTHCVLLA